MKRNAVAVLLAILFCICTVLSLTACGGLTDADVENAVGEATAPLNEEIAELQAELSELREELSELSASGETLEGEKAELLERIEALEGEKAELLERIEALEAENAILRNCLDGIHELDKYEYTASEDFRSATRGAVCKHCEDKYEEKTVDTVLEDYKLKATFADNDERVWDLTDGVTLTKDELYRAVGYLLENGYTDIDLTLPAEADVEKLLAIRAALVDSSVSRGAVNLTLRGVTQIPEYSENSSTASKTGIFGRWHYNDGTVSVDALGSVALTDATYIGANAFYSAELLLSVSAPLVTEVGEYAFSNAGLTSVDLPRLLTVGMSAFDGCAFAEIHLPAATHIGALAFMDCKNLTRVSLPSARCIDFYAFLLSSNITELILGSVLEVDYDDDGIFGSSVDTENINLTISCSQPNLLLGDDGVYKATDGLYIESADYENKHFMGLTFKSITLTHGYVNPETRVCSGCGGQIPVASVTVGGEKTYYLTVGEAITYANGKDALIVIEDDCVNRDIMAEFKSGSITLDLNGKTVNSESNYAIPINGATLTVRDSVGGGELIEAIGGWSGTLIIESGKYENVYNPGNLIIKGGEFSAAYQGANQTITLSGGSFDKLSIRTPDAFLEDGYCLYYEDGSVVDLTDLVPESAGDYVFYNVTVAPVK